MASNVPGPAKFLCVSPVAPPSHVVRNGGDEFPASLSVARVKLTYFVLEAHLHSCVDLELVDCVPMALREVKVL